MAQKRLGGKRKRQLRAYLIRRDGPWCGACGKPGYTSPDMRDDPLYLTIGHIKSAADGGMMTRKNSHLEHRVCNEERGTERLHETALRRIQAAK